MKDLQIGKVLKPQGIKGEIKVEIFDKQMNLDGVEELIIGKELRKIETQTIRQGFLYLSLEGVKIEDAEKLRGLEVLLPAEVAQKRLNPNEHYIENILGFNVFLSSDEEVGKLKEIQEYGAGEVMTIASTVGTEIMLPIANDVIEEIDEVAQKIVLNKTKFEEMSVYED